MKLPREVSSARAARGTLELKEDKDHHKSSKTRDGIHLLIPLQNTLCIHFKEAIPHGHNRRTEIGTHVQIPKRARAISVVVTLTGSLNSHTKVWRPSLVKMNQPPASTWSFFVPRFAN